MELAFAILLFAVLYLVFQFIKGIQDSHKSGSWKKPYSAKRTQQYIREKIRIENKHCANLPRIDSRGIYSGANGSFTDRTGKFSPEYQKEIDALNEKFGINDAD